MSGKTYFLMYLSGVTSGGAGGADCPPGQLKWGRRSEKMGTRRRGENRKRRGRRGRKRRKGEREGKEKGKEERRERRKGEGGREREGKRDDTDVLGTIPTFAPSD